MSIMNLDPDSVLMQRVREGDRDAFAELVDKYKQPIINFIARTLQDPTEAEDVAQNVFLQVYKAADRYEINARFSTWIFTIARNLCLNEIRRRSRHPADSLDATHEGDEEHPGRQVEDVRVIAPEKEVLNAELQQKIREILAELPENQRTAVLLCQQDEMSYEEIAKVIGCSMSATKSLIFRGRETLKQALKPYLKTGEWRNR
jgi:RNA polymerase sigma-70 factor (ECF subfamily)